MKNKNFLKVIFFEKIGVAVFFEKNLLLIKVMLTKSIKIYSILICYILNSCAVYEYPKDISLDDIAIMITEGNEYNEEEVGNEIGCLDILDFLMKEDVEKHTNLINKFNEITEGYRFLNENKNIMDKDAKKMYSMTLSMKKEYLCYILKFSSFRLLKNKMRIQY